MDLKPLSPGDLAIIIKSTNNKAVGRIVTCVSMDGIHSTYGRVWLVQDNRPILTVGGDSLRAAHVPEAWLMRIPNEPLTDDEDVVVSDELVEKV